MMPTPLNTAPFIIRRSDVAAALNQCNLIDSFDRACAAHRTPSEPTEDTITFAGGWTEEDTQDLIATSPRALWLMSRAGLIPISEEQALEAILMSGKQIERQQFPTANVQVIAAPLIALRMRAFGRWPAMRRAAPVEIVRVR